MLDWRTPFRWMVTLQFAVCTLLVMSAFLAIGTVLEASHGARAARFWVYESIFFKTTLGFFWINIFAVAMTRLPWQWRHVPFLLAHLGILMVLAGAWMSSRFGLDGTLQVKEGAETSLVETEATVLHFRADDGVLYSAVMPWRPPEAGFRSLSLKSLGWPVDWMVTDYLHVAQAEVTFKELSEATSGAVQFRIFGGPMQIDQAAWLWEGHDSWRQTVLGPVQVSLSDQPLKEKGLRLHFQRQKDALRVWTQAEGKKAKVFPLSKDVLSPGWAGNVQIQVLGWLPKAIPTWHYDPLPMKPGGQPKFEKKPHTEALYVSFEGGGGQWLGLQDQVQVRQGKVSGTLGYFRVATLLPWTLKLKKFELLTDPGTERAAAYRSLVSFLGKDQWIEMNEPLKYRGTTVYQTSYQLEKHGPSLSVFTINQDPGRGVKYMGSFFIVLGSLLLFLRQKLALRLRARSSVAASLFFFFLPLVSHASGFKEPKVIAGQSGFPSFQVGVLPVLHQGRVKPLSSFARQVVLQLSAQRSWRQMDPVETLLGMISYPRLWESEPFLWVEPEIRVQLGLDRELKHASPHQIMHLETLKSYAALLDSKEELDAQEKLIQGLLGRIGLFHAVISGSLWKVIPSNGDWLSFQFEGEVPAQVQSLRRRFAEWILSYQMSEMPTFARITDLLKAEMAFQLPIEQRSFFAPHVAEALLHVLPLFWWGAFCLLFAAFIIKKRPKWGVRLFQWGCLLQVSGLLLRCYAATRPPVTNMYESILWVSLGMPILAIMIYHWMKDTLLLQVGGILSFIALTVAESAPTALDSSIQPLMPVLRHPLWLTIHVLTITLSYAALGLSFGLSQWELFKASKQPQEPIHFSVLNYRCMQVGVVLLAAGTILGGVWADQSWGRFWGWDPKEVWALIALLLYIAVLHARLNGWLKPFGFLISTSLAFLSVIMAWYGVNFVLGAGLHSYGFAEGGGQWMALGIFMECLYLALVVTRLGRWPSFGRMMDWSSKGF